MRMRRGGFIALIDAMIFTIVVLMAMSALLGIGFVADEEGRDASAMLDGTLSAEVRMSDLVPDGDGSLVRVSDICALEMTAGGTGVMGYLEECLVAFSQGRPFVLVLTFGDDTASMGSPGDMEVSRAEVEVPITTGGSLHAELILYS